MTAVEAREKCLWNSLPICIKQRIEETIKFSVFHREPYKVELYKSVIPEAFMNLDDDITNNIDCGTNEDLFIALASMTDDEYGLCDYYIVITDCNPRYAKGSIHRALPLSSVIHPNCYRKATVEELIEHFNKK